MSERSYHGATSRSPLRAVTLKVVDPHETSSHKLLDLWCLVCNNLSIKSNGILILTVVASPCRSVMHNNLETQVSCRQRARCSPVVRAFVHGVVGCRDRYFMVDPLSYFSFRPVLNKWHNKGHSMCYPVYGMVHIIESLPLIGLLLSNPCGGSGFPLSLLYHMSDAI